MATLLTSSWFPFQAAPHCGALSGRRVWLRDPFMPTTAARIHARDMFLAYDVCAKDIVGAHVALPADRLTPLCDGGECCPAQAGVQMRVVAHGAHVGKVVWVREVHAVARESYTLWMYDRWRRPVVAVMRRDALVPAHAPLPCTPRRPTRVMTSGGPGLLLGYDHRTGLCRVDRRPQTQALAKQTRGDADADADLWRALPPCAPEAADALDWRGVVPLQLEYVPFGHRARLCGGVHQGCEVRVNGFVGFVTGQDGRRGLYALADGSGRVVEADVDLAAPAELLYSADTLHQYMVRVPPDVRALTFMVVSEAIPLRAVYAREGARLRCDKEKLRAALCRLDLAPAGAWDALLDRSGRLAPDEDRHHLRLLVRSLRALAQHCGAQARADRVSRSANAAAWVGGSLAQTPRKTTRKTTRKATRNTRKTRKKNKKKQ